jgi:hypothetical protein
MAELKSYKRLCEEREAVLCEAEDWKKGNSSYYDNIRIRLWGNSTYLDELLYIRLIIEKEMREHESISQMKVYNKFKIPRDISSLISSFIL